MTSVVLHVASSGKTYSSTVQTHREEAVFIYISSLDMATNHFTINLTDSEGHSLSGGAELIEMYAHTKNLCLLYNTTNVTTQESTSFYVPYSHGESLTSGDKVTFAVVGNLNLTDETPTGIYYYEFTLTDSGTSWYSEGTITRTQLNGHDIVNTQNYSTTNAYSCNYTEEHFQPKVLYGFVEPTNGQGVDGDIYLLLDDTPI